MELFKICEMLHGVVLEQISTPQESEEDTRPQTEEEDEERSLSEERKCNTFKLSQKQLIDTFEQAKAIVKCK